MQSLHSSSRNPTETHPVLRVMSYNVLFHHETRWGDAYRWPPRAPRVGALLRRYMPDLIGFQEVTASQLGDLTSSLPGYGVVGPESAVSPESSVNPESPLGPERPVGPVSPESPVSPKSSVSQESPVDPVSPSVMDGAAERPAPFIANPVFYARQRLRLLRSGWRWLAAPKEEAASGAEPPATEPARGWNGRHAVWCLFEDRMTGSCFVHLNTHWPTGRYRDLHPACARALWVMIEQVGGDGFPSIITGDFNRQDNLMLDRGLIDAWAAGDAPRSGPVGSKVNRETHQVVPGSTIDHILVGGGVRVSAFATIDDQEGGLYPSDHLPVLATLTLPPEREGAAAPAKLDASGRPSKSSATGPPVRLDTGAGSLLDIPAQRYLLLNSALLQATEHVHLQAGTPVKDNASPLFVEEYWAAPPRIWEARYDNLYPSVIYDEAMGLFRIWYKCFVRDAGSEHTAPRQRPAVPYRHGARQRGLLYASSNDGLSWTKPSLGLVEFGGSTSNNIVLLDVEGGVFRDERDPDTARRYKFFGRQDTGPRPMIGLHSADGVHWSAPEPWPQHGARADTHNNALWAPDLERYVGITRGWSEGARTVLRTESPDFVHWSEPTEIMRGDGPYDELYSMPVCRYGGVYLGLLAVLHGSPGHGDDRSRTDWNTVTTELAWSPDTVHWHRVQPGRPWIPMGQGTYPDGEADCGCIYASVPVFRDGEILLYYGGSNGRHNDWREGSLHLARLRQDGFAGYAAAPDQTGTVLTRFFPVAGTGDFRVNADVRDGGSLRVEVAGPDGCPLPGFRLEDCQPLPARAVDAPVTWKGRNWGELAGRVVRFRFELRQATLYSVVAAFMA